MSEEENRDKVILYWMEKAREALDSARSEMRAGRFSFAVNRAYYACFYAASALLLKEKQRFKKHAGVRAAVHRAFVKTGRVTQAWGDFYDLVFDSRQRGDHQGLVAFQQEQAAELVDKAAGFVEEMKRLSEETP